MAKNTMIRVPLSTQDNVAYGGTIPLKQNEAMPQVFYCVRINLFLLLNLPIAVDPQSSD